MRLANEEFVFEDVRSDRFQYAAQVRLSQRGTEVSDGGAYDQYRFTAKGITGVRPGCPVDSVLQNAGD